MKSSKAARSIAKCNDYLKNYRNLQKSPIGKENKLCANKPNVIEESVETNDRKSFSPKNSNYFADSLESFRTQKGHIKNG